MTDIYKPIFKRGDYKVRCDRTGATFNASDMAQEWDGTFVYKKTFRPRQPQELPVVFTDYMKPPIPRPDTGGNFVLPNNVDFGYDFNTDFNGLEYRN